MPQQQQRKRQPAKASEAGQERPTTGADQQKAHDEHVAEIDSLLDEIDAVLEEAIRESEEGTAESLVKGYQQKGGQ